MGEQVFIKSHGPQLDDDLLRLACLESVCASTGLARTAPVLSVDHERGNIIYERLEGLVPLSLAAGQDSDSFRKLGELLANMHHARPALVNTIPRNYEWEKNQLRMARIDETMIVRLINEFPAGFTHGDCWHGNILRQGSRWVILDPIPSDILLVGIGIKASGIFDLANMHMSLFACRPLKEYYSDVGSVARIYGQELLEGYLEYSSVPWSRAAILKLSKSLSMQWGTAFKQRLSKPVAILKQKMLENNCRKYYEGQ